MTDQDKLIVYVNDALKKGENTSFKRTSDFYEFKINGVNFFITTNNGGEDFYKLGFDPNTICSEDTGKLMLLKDGIEVARTNESNKNSKYILEKMKK